MASAARSARLPTISEWWYVPGVSISSRRSSGWDGLASSRSWNDRQDPEDVAEDGEGPDARRSRHHPPIARTRPRAEDPGQVALAEQRERRHDERLDDERNAAGLEERLQPISPPNAEDTGQAAEEDVRRRTRATAR